MEHEKKEEKKKEKTIIVNGREKIVNEKELTFEQLVALVYPVPPSGVNIVFTITYRKGHGHGHGSEGTLIEGESVKIKNGMIFNVTATDKS